MSAAEAALAISNAARFMRYRDIGNRRVGTPSYSVIEGSPVVRTRTLTPAFCRYFAVCSTTYSPPPPKSGMKRSCVSNTVIVRHHFPEGSPAEYEFRLGGAEAYPSSRTCGTETGPVTPCRPWPMPYV